MDIRTREAPRRWSESNSAALQASATRTVASRTRNRQQLKFYEARGARCASPMLQAPRGPDPSAHRFAGRASGTIPTSSRETAGEFPAGGPVQTRAERARLVGSEHRRLRGFAIREQELCLSSSPRWRKRSISFAIKRATRSPDRVGPGDRSVQAARCLVALSACTSTSARRSPSWTRPSQRASAGPSRPVRAGRPPPGRGRTSRSRRPPRHRCR